MFEQVISIFMGVPTLTIVASINLSNNPSKCIGRFIFGVHHRNFIIAVFLTPQIYHRILSFERPLL